MDKFTIKRNDTAIELTEAELREAHAFYEHQCQYEDFDARLLEKYPDLEQDTYSRILAAGKRLIDSDVFDRVMSNMDTYYEIYWGIIDFIVIRAEEGK